MSKEIVVINLDSEKESDLDLSGNDSLFQSSDTTSELDSIDKNPEKNKKSENTQNTQNTQNTEKSKINENQKNTENPQKSKDITKDGQQKPKNVPKNRKSTENRKNGETTNQNELKTPKDGIKMDETQKNQTTNEESPSRMVSSGEMKKSETLEVQKPEPRMVADGKNGAPFDDDRNFEKLMAVIEKVGLDKSNADSAQFPLIDFDAGDISQSLETRENKMKKLLERCTKLYQRKKQYDVIQQSIARQFNLSGPAAKTINLDTTAQDTDSLDRSVCLTNLHYKSTTEEIRALLADCGEIVRATIATNALGHPKGFAFVEFREAAAAERAVAKTGAVHRAREVKVTRKRQNIPGVGGGAKRPRLRAATRRVSYRSRRSGRGFRRGRSRFRGRAKRFR